MQHFRLISTFSGSEEKVSQAKRKFVSLYLDILYLAPKISNPYLNFKLQSRENNPLAPLDQLIVSPGSQLIP